MNGAQMMIVMTATLVRICRGFSSSKNPKMRFFCRDQPNKLKEPASALSVNLCRLCSERPSSHDTVHAGHPLQVFTTQHPVKQIDRKITITQFTAELVGVK